MVNNNTQKTTVTVGTVSESNIYLKKSELPKNLSSFKNDVGYISSSSLALWMKEHSYLSKSEINALISDSNLVVIDSINKQYDEDALRILDAKVNDMAGEIVAIKDKLREIDGNYIISDKEDTFATKGDIRIINTKIQNITTEISNIDLSNLATKAEIPVIPEIPSKVSQLENDKGYLTQHQSLAGYAKKSELPDTSKFITKDDIPSTEGLATQTWVKNQGYLKDHQSLKNYVKKSELPDTSDFVTKDELPVVPTGLASQQWVKDQGYLKDHQSLKNYAKKSELPDTSQFITKDDIPSVEGLASKEWVKGQGYLTDHQSLKNYATKSEIKDLASKEWVEELLSSPEEIDLAGYVKTEDLKKLESTITSISSSLKNYAKRGDLPDTSQFATKDEIPSTDGFATQTWVKNQGYLTKHQSLSGYAKKTDLDKFATQEFVTNLFDGTGEIDLSGYAKKSDIPTDYVKSSTLANKLSQYAKTSQIPTDVATQAWVQENFLSEAQDMSEFAKKTDLKDYVKTGTLSQYQKRKDALQMSEIESKFITKTDASKTYMTPEAVAKDYMKISDVKKDYLRIDDYRGKLKDILVINNTYNSMEELEGNLSNLIDGFYIVGSDLVIVKENTILNTIKDGIPQQQLVWIEEE